MPKICWQSASLKLDKSQDHFAQLSDVCYHFYAEAQHSTQNWQMVLEGIKKLLEGK